MLEIENFPLLFVTQAFEGLGQRELALFIDVEWRVIVIHMHVRVVCHLFVRTNARVKKQIKLELDTKYLTVSRILPREWLVEPAFNHTNNSYLLVAKMGGSCRLLYQKKHPPVLPQKWFKKFYFGCVYTLTVP